MNITNTYNISTQIAKDLAKEQWTTSECQSALSHLQKRVFDCNAGERYFLLGQLEKKLATRPMDEHNRKEYRILLILKALLSARVAVTEEERSFHVARAIHIVAAEIPAPDKP